MSENDVHHFYSNEEVIVFFSFYSFQLTRSSNYSYADFVFGHDDTVHHFHLWTQMGTGVCYTLQFKLSAFVAHFTLRHSLWAYYISSCAQTRHRHIGGVKVQIEEVTAPSV